MLICVKLASNFRFDELYHDLPLDKRPPNIIQLERCQGNSGLPPAPADTDVDWCSSSNLEFFTTPFTKTFTEMIQISDQQPTKKPNCFGFIFATDDLNQRAFVNKVLPKSDALSIFQHGKKTNKTKKAKLLGPYILVINDTPVHTKQDVISRLVDLHCDNAVSFSITFGSQDSFTSKEYDQALIHLDLEVPPPSTPSPDVDLDEDHIPSLSLDNVRHITAVLFDDSTTSQ